MPCTVWLVTIPIILSLSTSTLAIINIAACKQTIAAALLQDPALAYNDTIFFETPASAQNGSLTINGCEMYCAPGQPRIDPDCGNRLFQWLLPALFLVVSVAAPPVGWYYQVWTCVRPIADPFDSVLSVSHRLSICERCHQDAGTLVGQLKERTAKDRQVTKASESGESNNRRQSKFVAQDISQFQTSIALILYTFETVASHVNSRTSFLSAIISSSSLPTPTLVLLIHHTAGRLAEDRTRGLAQAWFTTASCIASLILATVPALGGSSPSGAMVAAALVLAPLARDVLLGHSIGEVGSHYRVCTVLAEFMEACQCADEDTKVKELGEALALAGSEKELEKLALTAGTSWYQPRRTLRDEQEGARTWNRTLAVALLLADTLTSFAAAAGALAAPPSYLNDRHFLMFGILGAWILSAATTWVLMRYSLSNLQNLGCFVAAKDILLAVTIPVLFSATTCGWLSSCRLWSNYYGHGFPRVPLDNSAAFAWNDGVLYPTLVGVCQGMNVLTYLVLRWLVYRKAFGVLVWSERAIGEALRAGGADRRLLKEKTGRLR
ncbi:Carboxylic ester hydrolase [Mycena venus]|uniref:Carboxylic ester hydrolase n=1 Tax=Mycena venus TaxID=2733690 RepID=A0A8H7CAV6_9AGAR|nr:Carboxylic ester hydrolase [Mycena venus]